MQGTAKNPLIVKSIEGEKTPERTEQERPEREEISANERRLIDWTIVLAAASIVLALVAGFQLGMFWKQLGIMKAGAKDTNDLALAAKASADAAKINAKNSKRAVETMQNVANAQLRAFVFPVNIFARWEHILETTLWGWRVQPQWQNSGSTPTKNLTIHVSGELRDTTLPVEFDFDYSAENIGNGLIPPRLTLMGGTVPLFGTPAISPQDIIDTQNGKKFFYLWGWAKYNDVFPGTPQHITRFCWLINVVGDPMKFVPNSTNPTEQLNFGYIYHMNGNCADEECDKGDA